MKENLKVKSYKMRQSYYKQ